MKPKLKNPKPHILTSSGGERRRSANYTFRRCPATIRATGLLCPFGNPLLRASILTDRLPWAANRHSACGFCRITSLRLHRNKHPHLKDKRYFGRIRPYMFPSRFLPQWAFLLLVQAKPCVKNRTGVGSNR